MQTPTATQDVLDGEGRAGRLEGSVASGLLVLGFLAGSCLAPPALLKATPIPWDQAMALYPPGTELGIVRDHDGRGLATFHVPARPDSPLVLHLLDSSGSIAGAGSDFGVLAWQLRELGFASLFVDYTGVGLSAGERSVDNLGGDAELAWKRALTLVNGDESRLLVRGISIGTVAAAQLLERGARPRAMLWIAPVRPATVVPRFAREFHGFFAWLAASVLFRPVARLEPAEVITASCVPVHVLGSSRDALLSRDEREELERAALGSGGSWHDTFADHVFLGVRARRLAPEELALLRPLAPPGAAADTAAVLGALSASIRERLTGDPVAGERLGHLAVTQPGAAPLDLAAAALSNEDWVDSWRLLWLHRIRPFPELGFEQRIADLSLAGFAGKPSAELVEYLSSSHDQAWRYDHTVHLPEPREVGALALRDQPCRIAYDLRCGLKYRVAFDLASTWTGLFMDTRDPDRATLELARYLLKSLRIPARLDEAPDGSPRLEAYWQEKWEPVPCTPSR